MSRRQLLTLAGAAGALIALTVLLGAGGASATTRTPMVVHDVKTGSDTLTGPTSAGSDPIQDYVQPDTEIEPSIAVNPRDAQNVVAVYQLSRIADGGDATNGFAASLDGGKTWTTGTLPGLTV